MSLHYTTSRNPNSGIISYFKDTLSVTIINIVHIQRNGYICFNNFTSASKSNHNQHRFAEANDDSTNTTTVTCYVFIIPVYIESYSFLHKLMNDILSLFTQICVNKDERSFNHSNAPS